LPVADHLPMRKKGTSLPGSTPLPYGEVVRFVIGKG
jgi:hypothetical protein